MEPPTNVSDSPEDPDDARLATQTFRDFADRLAARDDEAAAELLGRYSARLVNLARWKLSPRLAVKAAPEDVLQTVLRTFFRRLGEGEVELRDWSSLSGLLSLITIRKCEQLARRYGAAKKDVAREVPLSGAAGSGPTILDREPSPDEQATFIDLVERLLQDLSERDRQIVEGLLAGDSVPDIAARVNRSETAVYWALRKIRGRILNGPLGRELLE